SKDVEMVRYGSQVKRWLSKCRKPEKYLLVVTGHQGEPNSTLSKMVDGHLFNFQHEDIVVFSCKIIPVEPNISNREKMEEKLKAKHVRIFRDIHSSGHAAREDHRELIHAVDPEHIIPAHADIENLESLKELALEIGYKEDKVHIVGNGEKVTLP
ncbi:MAG: hypothetical protein MI923_23365, partial [Phycisphaerales bacterium]|nr:hypothetical protein [Phycisphaerales bacterium]